MGVNQKPGRWALKSRQWPKVRREALRRDGWRCQHCGWVRGLEVHHLRPVREAPELAFSLDNLLTLCRRCHTDETNRELGHAPDPLRREWKAAVLELVKEGV